MRLALICPPFFHKVFNENLPTVDDEFGLFPQIAFGWVAAAAKEAGADVRLFDAAATKFSYDEMLALVREYDPDLLCFGAHAVQSFRDMLAWAERFKTDTALPALVGGYEAKIYPREIMAHACFDYLCLGEAATFLPPFLSAFEKGRGYASVPDLIYRKNGALIQTEPAPNLPFSKHPMPDRSIFPNHLYYSHVSQRHNFTIGMSSLGCPYPCRFCAVRMTGFDARPATLVVDEMEFEARAHHVREVDWFDPLMLFERQRALDISSEMQRRRLDVIWSARTRLDALAFHRPDGEPDEELIRQIAAAGCRRLFLGLESGDDDVLKLMLKKQKTSYQKKVLDCLVANGIRPLGFFMVGAPGDDVKSVRKTIRHACSLPLEYAQFTLTIMKPPTDLEKDYMVGATGVDYWREYVRGTIDEFVLPTPWTELTRADQENLAREAYVRFYLRPRHAWEIVKKIESSEELARYLRVALQLILRPIMMDRKQGVSASVRAGRALRAFLEACVASLNPGGRHPVRGHGGGLRGAWRVALEEWRRSAVRQEAVAAGLWTPVHPGRDVPRLADRYVPLSSGALGTPRSKSNAGKTA